MFKICSKYKKNKKSNEFYQRKNGIIHSEYVANIKKGKTIICNY